MCRTWNLSALYTFYSSETNTELGYKLGSNAFVVIGVRGDNYYIIDEYSSKESTTSQLAEVVSEMTDVHDIESIYIDSASAQLRADFAYDYDIQCDNAIKSVNDGISFLQVLIEHDRLFFDINNANHTFMSMSSYNWNSKTETPKPIHDWPSHSSDAVRYGIYTFHKMSSMEIYA